MFLSRLFPSYTLTFVNSCVHIVCIMLCLIFGLGASALFQVFEMNQKHHLNVCIAALSTVAFDSSPSSSLERLRPKTCLQSPTKTLTSQPHIPSPKLWAPLSALASPPTDFYFHCIHLCYPFCFIFSLPEVCPPPPWEPAQVAMSIAGGPSDTWLWADGLQSRLSPKS